MDGIISNIFSRYCLILLFILGTIGLTLNTLIFTRKIFRRNSCIHYFLASTIANYFVVYFILTSRILSDGFNIDPGTYNLLYCKLRFYIYYTAKSLSSWFIVLACYDRKMSSASNAQQREFSRVETSRRMIIITTSIGLVFYGHVLIFFEINQNNQCVARSGVYRLLLDSFYLIGYSVTPPVLMLVFGTWTIINTRHLRRVIPRRNREMLILNKRDHTLMLMLFLQVILITLTAVPHAIQKLYTTITTDWQGDQNIKQTNDILIIVVRAISFFNHSCTFYILTLSGRIFRQELVAIMTKVMCKTRQQRRITIVHTVKFYSNNQQLCIRIQKENN